ncbi:hemicentin-2-like [Carassius auratus]|uniref:Hemicentin-2-like n=1 Tax=Carassius auratus TaxID=7957 RepID=A0A6P6M5T5_CARAU|nr:hemicentin-2-like [Carassius auratus]
MNSALLLSLLLPVAVVSHVLDLPRKVLFKLGDRRELRCSMSSCPEKVKFVWKPLEDKPKYATIKTQDRESVLVYDNVKKYHEYSLVCKATCEKETKQATAKIQVYSFSRNPVISGHDSLKLGEKNVLRCEVSSVHPPELLTVQWLYEGKVLQTNEGEPESNYIFTPSSEDDGKVITCRASLNVDGIPLDEKTKETSVHMTVFSAPHNVKISGATAVPLGSSLNLTCEAEGKPKPAFTWTALKPDGQSVEMGKYRDLLVHNVSLSDAATYQCDVTNDFGSQRANVSVVVQAPPMNTLLEASPQSILKEGESVNISCKSSVVPVTHVVLSRRVNGAKIELASSKGAETSLALLSVNLTDSGEFVCEAFNDYGSQETTLNLTVEAHLLEVVLQPDKVVLERGSRLVLSCQAFGCPQPKFSWKNLSNTPILRRLETDDLQSQLVFDLVELEDEGTYRCEVTCGSIKKSKQTEVKVFSFSRNPVISGHDSLKLGEKNVLRCEVSSVHPSELLTVQWLYEGEVLQTNEGEPESNYIFTPSSEDDGKAITCRASLNVDGIPPDEKTKETSVHMTVFSAPHNVKISGATAVPLGSSLNLTCEAEGKPKPAFTWTALKPDGQSVEMGKHRDLLVHNVSLSDAATYQCDVTNDFGSQRANVSVVVQAPPMNTLIEASPQSILKEGESVNISCKSSVVPVTHVVLSRRVNGAKIELASSKEAETSLALLSVNLTDSGEFVCEAFNDYGSQETTLNLTVEAHLLEVVLQPDEVVLERGSRLVLTCQAFGCPQPKFSWKNLSNTPILRRLETDDLQSQLVFDLVELDDEGTYLCEVTCGSIKKSKQTEVKVFSFSRNPVISGHDSLKLGEKNVLRCEVSSVHPSELLTVQWLYEGEVLQTNEGEPESNYIFTPSSEDDGKAITCRASLNVDGIPLDEKTKETSVHMTVFSAPHNVKISGATAVPLGSSLNLTCEAEGKPKPAFTWTALKPDGQSVEMGKHRDLLVHNVSLSDAATYQCDVRNDFGSQRANVSVVVQAPPMNTLIEASPPSILKEGESVNISCKSSVVPVTHVVLSRRVNGAKIELASSKEAETSLALLSVNLTDSGEFVCEAFNDYGSQETTLNLTVEAHLLEVVLQPDKVVLERGSRLVLSCQAFGCPQPKFSWKNLSNTPILRRLETDDLQSQLVFDLVELEDEGTYLCEVTCGSIKKSKQTEVKVFYPPRVPRITVSPLTELKEGESVTISCLSDSFPVGRTVLNRVVDGIQTELMASDRLETLFTIPSLELDDSGIYICETSNMYGSRNDSVEIKVKAPPRNMTVEIFPSTDVQEGQNITICCRSVSFPPPAVVLSKLDSEKHVYSLDGVFLLINLKPNDTGLYQINVTNYLGYETETFNINVIEKRVNPPFGWNDFFMPAISLGVAAALLGVVVYMWRARKKGSYDLAKCNPGTV